MSFYVLLLAVNFACFVPLYVLHFREAPNPFAFLAVADRTKWTGWIRFLYDKARSTDPFRIDFDFTFFLLVCAAAGVRGRAAIFLGAALLAFGVIEILYTTLMQSVFKRAPMLASDLSLLRSGLQLAQRQIYWIAPLTGALLVAIGFASYRAASALFELMPEDGTLPLIAALLSLPLCLHHCLRYGYAELLWRTAYSPALHLYRNVRYGKRMKSLLRKNAEHFERRNDYKDIVLRGSPNVVVACIESYGSIVHREPSYGQGSSELLRGYEQELARAGYHVASTHSEAPLFAGGSWLSYASFTYGLAVTDVQVFDMLFVQPSNFGRYESLFHVLARNGYSNVLLCPLGGVDAHTVDWESVDRCFQSKHKITFDDLSYEGPRVNYFGLIRRYSAPDQYALNFGYERARRISAGPFSLFFCTLNSHYPWHTQPEVVPDWRSLNDSNIELPSHDGPAVERYAAAIRYQLDYLLRFVVERAEDAPLVILFGDHQPPMITPERMGKHTPVHVISRDRALIDVFMEHGFCAGLDMSRSRPRAIKHEGFLSLFMKAMQTAYGATPGLTVEYREQGVALLENSPLEHDAHAHAAH